MEEMVALSYRTKGQCFITLEKKLLQRNDNIPRKVRCLLKEAEDIICSLVYRKFNIQAICDKPDKRAYVKKS